MTVRQATREDLGPIRDIYNEAVLNTDATLDDVAWTTADAEAWLDVHDDTHTVLVADVDDTVVGYGALTPLAPRAGYRASAEISVYVAPEWQRSGHGTALCRALTAHADARGLASATALITASNTVSRRLFESAGYRRQGCLRQVGAKFGRIVDVEIYQWLPPENGEPSLLLGSN